MAVQPPLEAPGKPRTAISGKRETIGHRVYRNLRAAIVQLDIRPGDMISEADVSRRLGVSRQPVREAFIKLSDIGLVEIAPQRGTFVVRISIPEVTNALFVRQAIEIAVARRACEVATDAEIAGLRDLIDGQVEAKKSGKRALFMALDESFHEELARCAGYPSAWRSIDAVKAQMDRVRFLALPLEKRMPRIISRHRGIVAALKSRLPDRAEAAMRVHLSEILIALPLLAERHPDLFSDEPA